MSLYLTREPQFEKIATGKLLSDSSDQWPNEILSHLYRQHEYLGSYKVDLKIQSQDTERGYAYGYFLVTPQPTMPPQTTMDGVVPNQNPQEIEQKSLSGDGLSVRVVLIIQNRKLFPLDIMITPDGKFLPLSNERVEGILQVPEAFSAVKLPQGAAASGDGGITNTPPVRQGTSNGGSGPVVKEASVLSKIASLIPDNRKQLFFDSLNTPEMRFSLDNNDAFRDAVGVVWNSKEASPVKAKADAVVFEKTAGGYLMHSASFDGFSPEEELIKRQDADLVGEYLPILHKEGSVLVGHSDNIPQETEFGLVKKAGHYQVLSNDGEVTHGVVVSNLIGLDGESRSGNLFLNAEDEAYAQQEKIAGVYIGHGSFFRGTPTLAEEAAHGVGCFVKIAEYGGIQKATQPVEIHNAFQDPDGTVTYQASDGLAMFHVKVASLLQEPCKLGNDFAVPMDWSFLPLGKATLLAEDPYLAKQAAALGVGGEVEIIHSDGNFTFRGSCGVSDLPKDSRQHLKTASALLLAGCLGLSDDVAKVKLSSAVTRGSATFRSIRHLVTTKVKKAQAEEGATARRQQFDLAPVYLVKEASSINDGATVDAILSLGFLAPDNIQSYLDSMDQFDQVISKLAELVVACRLGLQDVPEVAATKAMQGIDEIIKGLRRLESRTSQQQTQGAYGGK